MHVRELKNPYMPQKRYNYSPMSEDFRTEVIKMNFDTSPDLADRISRSHFGVDG